MFMIFENFTLAIDNRSVAGAQTFDLTNPSHQQMFERAPA